MEPGVISGSASMDMWLRGADGLMVGVYAAMAQKERELIPKRTRAALVARE